MANTTQEDLPDASESQPVSGFSSNGIFAESERENSGLSPIVRHIGVALRHLLTHYSIYHLPQPSGPYHP